MEKLLFANTASSTASGSTSVGGTLALGMTTLVLASGTGALFPSPSVGEAFLLTIFEKNGSALEENIEVVKVTARTADTLTIVRAVEGTQYAYPTIDSRVVYVANRLTAATASQFAQKDLNLSDLANVSTARTNLDLGTVATHDASEFEAAITKATGYAKWTGAAWSFVNESYAVESSQLANLFYASPNGAPGNPIYRSIVAEDVPTLNQNTTGSSASCTGNAATATTATKSTNLVGGNGTTLLGSLPYQSGTDTSTLLSPNTTTTRKFMRMTGTGTNGAAPVWDTLLAADVPTLNQNTTGSSATCTGNAASASTAAACTGNHTNGTVQQNQGAYIYPGYTTASGNNQASYYFAAHSTYGMYTNTGLYVAGGVYSASDVYAYYSDERLKTRVGAIDNALDKVKSLDAFLYINNDLAKSFGYTDERVQVGLSAQQVKAVQPEVVGLAPFDMDGDGSDEIGKVTSKSGEEYLTVKYEKLVPLLIAAIQELSSQVDELRDRK